MAKKYRIDNGGCRAAYVHAIAPNKCYFDTAEEACEAAKVLHETDKGRDFPYYIVEVEGETYKGGVVVLEINED